ncbi:MAG: ribosome maturation factor RimP [Deltaproteobacteria bacterium]|nr:ribosome maturation factor RimP [Deltaproteobacteria bacterium]
MEEIRRRIEALARPIAAAFGCDVVGVRYGQGRKRAIVTIFLDTVQPEPTAEERQAASRPFDAEREPAPPPYAGSSVSVDACSRVSREVSAAIDAEGVIAGSYVLEVSSPGLERPLVRSADFVRHRGRRVELRTVEAVAGSQMVRGMLAAVEAEAVWVVPGEAQGGAAVAARRIPFDVLRSARLLYEVKVPVKPGRPGSKARKR